MEASKLGSAMACVSPSEPVPVEAMAHRISPSGTTAAVCIVLTEAQELRAKAERSKKSSEINVFLLMSDPFGRNVRSSVAHIRRITKEAYERL